MTKGPDAFRTISEVAAQLETPAHVLRFWESKFPQIKPVKGAGGRRYFRPDDVALLSGIKVMLHEQGMTIRGVQKLLRERGARYVATLSSLPWDGAEALTVVAEPPGPSVEEAAPTEAPEELAEVEEPSAEVVRGPWPEAVPATGEVSLARLRAAVEGADRDRLAALSGRIAPLVDRLRGLRDGPLRQAG
jgi:DNA-binding transcriptional MerR regulator